MTKKPAERELRDEAKMQEIKEVLTHLSEPILRELRTQIDRELAKMEPQRFSGSTGESN
jgi:hypothetical protein